MYGISGVNILPPLFITINILLHLLPALENLLAKVMVDKGGFQSQVSGTVCAITFILATKRILIQIPIVRIYYCKGIVIILS